MCHQIDRIQGLHFTNRSTNLTLSWHTFAMKRQHLIDTVLLVATCGQHKLNKRQMQTSCASLASPSSFSPECALSLGSLGFGMSNGKKTVVRNQRPASFHSQVSTNDLEFLSCWPSSSPSSFSSFSSSSSSLSPFCDLSEANKNRKAWLLAKAENCRLTG